MNANTVIWHGVVFSVALFLTACGEKVVPQPPQPGTCGNYMTNTEIIAETKLCNGEGLDAVALHCGNDQQTVIIECRPRTLPATQESGE